MKKTLLALSLALFNCSAFADVLIVDNTPGPLAETFKVTYKSCVQIPNQGNKCGPSETIMITGNGTIPLSPDVVDFTIEKIDMPYASYHLNCAGFNNQAFALSGNRDTMLCTVATAYAKPERDRI